MDGLFDYISQTIENLLGKVKKNLRKWQSDALDTYDKKKQLHQKNPSKNKSCFKYLIESCPGGGKTIAGIEIAAEDFIRGEIDVIVIVAPSILIKKGWAEEAKKYGFIATANSDYFSKDVQVFCVTYSGIDKVFRYLEGNKKILLIFDEYHHAERKKAWGNNVEELLVIAKKAIFLSGTPWRSENEIAGLREDGYYSDDGIVTSDFKYLYADDLKSDSRGTLPFHFDLIDSKVYRTDLETGQSILDDILIPPYSEDEWNELLEKNINDLPKPKLGSHTNCSNIYKNKTAINLLDKTKVYLEKARVEHCPYAMALVVASDINQAKIISKYIQRELQLSAVTIVSRDDDEESQNVAIHRIEHIQNELKKRHPNIPDVIVAVGMISEGVNIPAIKVICYLSRITTPLYLIQVLFRAGRRIPKLFNSAGKQLQNQYWDEHLSMNKCGYFLAPAHPMICWLAAHLKKDIYGALRIKEDTPPEGDETLVGGDGGDREPILIEIAQESDGNSALISNSQLIPKDIEENLTYLRDCSGIEDYYASGEKFIRWFHEAMAGEEKEQLRTIRIVRNLITQFSAEINEIQRNRQQYSSPVPPRDYDAEMREVGEEIKKIANRIRFSKILIGKDYFCDLDDALAYKLVYATINQRTGIKTLEHASLAEKNKWVVEAKNFIKEGGFNV